MMQGDPTYLKDLHKEIGKLRLRHFRAHEVTDLFTKNPGNEAPPRELWPNIYPTLIVFDQIREECGFPIRFSSSSRDPVFNAAEGGGDASQHLIFSALDGQPVTKDGRGHWQRARTMYKVALSMRGRLFEHPLVLKTRETLPWLNQLESNHGGWGYRDINPAARWTGRWSSFPDRKAFPWKDLRWWTSMEDGMLDDQPAASYVFRWAGGVGRYNWGVHVDTRGLNHTWSGS